MTVGPSWSSSDDPVLNLIGAERPYYLAAVTYDHYTGRGWSQTGSRQRAVAAEEDVFPGWTPDRPLVEEGFEPVTVTVQLLKPQGRDLYTPAFRCGSSRRRSSPSRARGRSSAASKRPATRRPDVRRDRGRPT